MEKHQAKIGKNQKTWLKKSILLFVSILFISTAAFSQNEHFNFKYENIKLSDYFGKSEPPFRQSEPPAKVGWICM